MYTQHPETLNQMVAYNHERVEAGMRAAESDRAVWLQYRTQFGSFLISLGERLRGDCRDLMSTASPDRVPSARLRVPAKGTHV